MAVGALVAGVDSSTQQCKLVVVEAGTGTVVDSVSVPHPDGTEIDPRRWAEALDATGAALRTDIAAVSVAAQQHGAVFLDAAYEPVRDAVLWNDLRAADAARRLRAERGDGWWLGEVGLLPAATHPVAKLRWLSEAEPAAAAAVATVAMPHDYLTWHLGGRGELVTDRSDASATGYFSLAAGDWNGEALGSALGRDVALPRVAGTAERVGRTPGGAVIGPGCGDNPAAALALGAGRGDAVLSIGTSLTVSVATPGSVADPSGEIDDMLAADAFHRPLAVSLNGARTLVATAKLLGVGLRELSVLARSGRPDADGLTFLATLDGERGGAPEAGALVGMTRRNMVPRNLARAAVLALADTAAQFLDRFGQCGVDVGRVIAVGGGSRSDSVCQAVADLTRRVVVRPPTSEYAALGAARQAAWTLTGELPGWAPATSGRTFAPAPEEKWMAEVRRRRRAAQPSR